MNYRVRPFALSDVDAVKALCQWAWWPRRSLEGWKWLTTGAPGTPFTEASPPGWVCETDDGVLGFLGNFLQRLDFSGENLVAASAHTLLVDPKIKGAGRELLRSFAGQDLALRHVLNANDRSASMYKHFAMWPSPGPDSRVKYVWHTNWTGVASERAVRWFHSLAGTRGGREQFLDSRIWTGAIGACRPGVSPVPVAEIDERFDQLWSRLRVDGRLLCARDADSLRWRCADPDLTREPLLLAYEADGVLAGYLLAFFSKGSEIERPALEIIDLIALTDEEPTAIPALVRSLLGAARALGAVRVRLSVVCERMEALLAPFRAARRTYHHDHSHVRWARDIDETIRHAWYATPYDGDYSFCLRPPPGPAAYRTAAK